MEDERQIKVLLIEKNEAEAVMLQELLQEEKSVLNMQWVDGLSPALELLENDGFDIVVTDLQLPDSRGLETFEAIHERYPYEPVVVMTGIDDQDLAIDAVRKGAQDYLIKGRAKGHSILRLLKHSIERQRLLNECARHLKEIKTLRGLIPVCAWCRKVHSHKGYWEKVEKFIEQQTDASFSHGICPECLARTEPEIFELIKRETPEVLEREGGSRSEKRAIRLLLVEDNPDDVDLVREFAALGDEYLFAISDAGRLSEAVDILSQDSFDLVLCDLGLPDSQGLETFIKLHTMVPDVPIIVLTGMSDRELAMTAVRSGAQDYIMKGEIRGPLLGKAVQYAIERHKMLKDLRKNLREVGKLQRERENLLSAFAHDIRNAVMPAAMLLTRVLSGKTVLAEDKVRPVGDGLKAAENMLGDFIEYSRFEGREYEPEKRAFDLEEAIERQIELTRIKAEEKNIRIDAEFLVMPLPDLQADGRMIERVLANLVDNAVKYTPPGGTVEIMVRKVTKNLVVQVKDTGIGIAEDHLPHIFEAFYRVPGKERGSGLGLSIARTIVKAHGGEIWVNSTPAEGSMFNFSLPLQE